MTRWRGSRTHRLCSLFFFPPPENEEMSEGVAYILYSPSFFSFPREGGEGRGEKLLQQYRRRNPSSPLSPFPLFPFPAGVRKRRDQYYHSEAPFPSSLSFLQGVCELGNVVPTRAATKTLLFSPSLFHSFPPLGIVRKRLGHSSLFFFLPFFFPPLV